MVVVAGSFSETVSRAQREAMGLAQQVAHALSTEVTLVAVGPNVSTIPSQLAGYGIGRVIAVPLDVSAHDTETYIHNLHRAVATLNPAVILMGGSELARETAPRLAFRLGGVALNDVIDVRLDDGRLVCTRPVFGGKAVEDLIPARDLAVLVLRQGAFPVHETAGDETGVPEVTELEAERLETGVTVTERSQPQSTGPTLESASVVVAGGRGLGSAAAFSALRELASILGGAVASSRPPVDDGWVPPDYQVGQTGKVISPDLYIAVGISGASQHLLGIAGAKMVVAINSDRRAPIFSRAQLGVAMDYQEVLPALIARCRRLHGN